MRKPLLAIAALLLVGAANAAEPKWELQKQDDFNRIGLGTDWLVLRGEWHINKDKQLEIQRQWGSHSVMAHNMNLSGKNVKVELDVQVPSRMLGYVFLLNKRKRRMTDTGFGINLQSGILEWSGGGIDDRAGIELNATMVEERKKAFTISLDRWVHVVLALVDGKVTVTLDGKVVKEQTIPQGRSLVNTGLALYAVPCALFDNLKISTAPMATPLPVLNGATAKENRKATILLAPRDIDPNKSDCGIQEAIDSLPRGGSKARLFGNIAGLNGSTGYNVRSPGALLAGNNAHNNMQAGILVEDATDVVVAGNTCANNNQSCALAGGIHLKGETVGARVLYNNCGDDQQIATQRAGIHEESTVKKSEIRFNCTATLVKRKGRDSSLIAKGKRRKVADNWTKTLVPVGDALEAIKYYKDEKLTMDK